MKHHIYQSLLVGNRTERSLAYEKTHNRHIERARKNKIKGLPEKGRASASKVITWPSYQIQNKHLSVFDAHTAWEALPQRQVKKNRVDPETRQVTTWDEFQQRFAYLSPEDRWAKWKSLPRRKQPCLLRDFKGSRLSWSDCVAEYRYYNGTPLSWSDCVTQYRDYWTIRHMWRWFCQLPRIQQKHSK